MMKKEFALFSMILILLLESCILKNIPNLNGRIAFGSDQNGNHDIYVIDANGQNLIQLTDNPAGDYSPAWSPDGKEIVFVSDRDGNREIYKMKADGSDQVRLTNSPISDDYSPKWSPNGKEIIFSSDASLILLDLASGKANKITLDNAWEYQPSWSPDGQKLVFQYFHFDLHSNEKNAIYLMNRDGSGSIALTDLDQHNAEVGVPTWSPDGTKIAFGKVVYSDPITVGTFIIFPDGSNIKQITDECAGGSWSPDSKWVVCISKSGGNNNSSEIYIINDADGTKYRLTDTPYFEYEPAWSPK